MSIARNYDLDLMDKNVKLSMKYYVLLKDEEILLIKEYSLYTLYNSIFKTNESIFKILIKKQENFKNLKNNEKKKIKKTIDKLEEVIKIAKNRIKDTNYKIFKKQNEKIYYSSIAIKNILEELLDDKFMNLSQGVNFSNDKIDVLEYGKGIESAEVALKDIIWKTALS